MNVFKTYFWFFLIAPNFLFAQSISLRKITKLPSQANETSGIIAFDKGFFWTHNDSGNEPAIFKIDTSGNILRKIIVKNAVNIDWEDITKDNDSNFFIGDFGNNNNTRKDLKIYKIQNPENSTNDSVTAEIISFYYSNQTQFPPQANQMNFDAEAFIYFQENLYIFTKNYTTPFSGYTYLYKIPSAIGSHKAELIDSFKTGDGIKELWWVTSAALSPDFKKLILLSTDKLFVFSDFTDDNFLKGKNLTIDLGFVSQKEAVSFINNVDFYITDEYNSLFDGMNLYNGSLKGFYSSAIVGSFKNLKTLINVGENDSGFSVYLIDISQNIEVMVTDMNGKFFGKCTLNKNTPSKDFVAPLGFYNLTLSDGLGYQHLKFVKYQ